MSGKFRLDPGSGGGGSGGMTHTDTSKMSLGNSTGCSSTTDIAQMMTQLTKSNKGEMLRYLPLKVPQYVQGPPMSAVPG